MSEIQSKLFRVNVHQELLSFEYKQGERNASELMSLQHVSNFPRPVETGPWLKWSDRATRCVDPSVKHVKHLRTFLSHHPYFPVTTRTFLCQTTRYFHFRHTSFTAIGIAACFAHHMSSVSPSVLLP
jgi:hypothetical protein